MAMSDTLAAGLRRTLPQSRPHCGPATQLVPEDWVRRILAGRAPIRVYSGDGYGYGWFDACQIGGQDVVHYAWGFGGQMLYIVPDSRR
jgi:CubicO group peptidase (beta-lactamase class C family)